MHNAILRVGSEIWKLKLTKFRLARGREAERLSRIYPGYRVIVVNDQRPSTTAHVAAIATAMAWAGAA